MSLPNPSLIFPAIIKFSTGNVRFDSPDGGSESAPTILQCYPSSCIVAPVSDTIQFVEMKLLQPLSPDQTTYGEGMLRIARGKTPPGCVKILQSTPQTMFMLHIENRTTPTNHTTQFRYGNEDAPRNVPLPVSSGRVVSLFAES